MYTGISQRRWLSLPSLPIPPRLKALNPISQANESSFHDTVTSASTTGTPTSPLQTPPPTTRYGQVDAEKKKSY